MIRLGDLLIQAKESVGHGQFYPWLEQNCDLGKRQAQRHMKVAQHREIVERANASRATHLSLTAALEAIDKELEGKLKDSSKDPEDQDAPQLDYGAELDRHRNRCKEFRRFLQDETSIEAGPALKRVVQKGMDKFVRDLIKVARRHGKKITTKALRELGTDEDLVAMVLVADAADRLDPVKDFAPKEPPQ